MSKIGSFLSHAGKVLSSGLTVASQFIPILQPFFGSASQAAQDAYAKAGGLITTVKNDLTLVGQTVVQIEAAMQGYAGTAKLAAAAAIVAPIIRTSEFLSGLQIANESEFIAGVKDLISAIVRILNSCHKTNVLPGDVGPVPVAPPATPSPVIDVTGPTA